jgi:hypothetical protein
MLVKIRTALSLMAVLLVLGGMTSLRAQTDSSGDAAPLLSPDDLQQLVAPIALYPDPLIALILTGSTVPTDIVLADRYVQNDGDPDDIDSQNWDDSVKGLARYPDVLKMMDDNLDWTNQLGAAVIAQQADVMTAIQAQRARAAALGNLESTPQQQVIDDGGVYQIIPADPQVIYVPVYDPQVIYVDRGPNLLSFGIGFAIGAWLNGDCDWHNHGIYRGGYYRAGHGWARPINIIINRPPVWRPNPNKPKPRPPYRPNRPGGGGHGQLPGWHRPPGGNKPSPGKPGRPGQVRPQPKPTPTPGNGTRPSKDRPQIQPVPGNGTRPSKDRPQIQPVPGNGNRPGTGKPGSTRPTIQPVTRPAPGADRPRPSRQPAATQPHVKPAPRPQVQPARPAVRPAAPVSHTPFNQQRPSTKRSNENHAAPAKAARPAPAKSAPAKARAPAQSDKKR